MEIMMKSEVYEIKQIKRKTKANVMKNWKIGDKIQLSVKASRVGIGDSGTYATYINVNNITDGTHTMFSFNQISIIYNVFELCEV